MANKGTDFNKMWQERVKEIEIEERIRLDKHEVNKDYRLHDPQDCAKKIDRDHPVGQCGKALISAMNEYEAAQDTLQALGKLMDVVQLSPQYPEIAPEKFGFNRTEPQIRDMLGIIGKRFRRVSRNGRIAIRPVMLEKGNLYYRKCNVFKYRSVSFTWEDDMKGARANDIEPIDDMDNGRIVMLSTYGYYGLFKPSLYEVMQFIPDKYLGGGKGKEQKVVAFRILGDEQVAWDSKVDDEHSTMGRKHIIGEFHWAWVQLYQKKIRAKSTIKSVRRSISPLKP